MYLTLDLTLLPLYLLTLKACLSHLPLPHPHPHQTEFRYDDEFVVFFYLAALVLAYILSAILFVFVEQPVAKLEVLLLGRA